VATAIEKLTMILTYHEIVPHSSRYLYSLSCERLEEHVRLLVALRSEPSPVTGLTMTFDDGHSSHYRYAVPVLQDHSCRGIFFVTVGWTGMRPGYMDWQQLRDIVSMGHEVQSHGWSHKYLTYCSAPELSAELQRSKKTLEDRLGTPVEALSAPGGVWNAIVAEACVAAQYKRLYISDPWFRSKPSPELQILGRAQVRRTLDTRGVRRLLAAERNPFSMMRATSRLKQAVRAGLGDRIYHQLWLRLAKAGEEIKEETYF